MVKTYDNMLSRFHLIPERDGQTDRQNCYINIARQYAQAPPRCTINGQCTNFVLFDMGCGTIIAFGVNDGRNDAPPSRIETGPNLHFSGSFELL